MLRLIVENQKFYSWQKSTLHTECGEITRHRALTLFVRNDLIPFILANGYNISVDASKFENSIATFLYHYGRNKNYMFPIKTSVVFSSEHYDHYNYVVDWDSFWSAIDYKYGYIFAYSTGGCAVQIEAIVWGFIDLHKSQAYNDYMISIQDLENDKKEDKLDPYIRDQLNRENHHKFTKFEL